MKVIIWGSRGSIPSPGKSTVKYGGETTCVEVQSESGGRIIIDAGSGIRDLGHVISKKKEKNVRILLTHGHWDHVQGLCFFAPLFRKGTTVRIDGGANGSEELVKRQFGAPFFPVDFNQLPSKLILSKSAPKKMTIHGCQVTPIPLSHPNGGFGYKITEKGKSFVFLTDNEPDFDHKTGLDIEGYAQIAKGADLLLHDSQYLPEAFDVVRGWGHSTWEVSAEIALKAGVKRLGLIHHDPAHSDKIVAKKEKLANAKVKKAKGTFHCCSIMDRSVLNL